MDDMQTWLSLIFAGLMGLAILIYVCLDGYDLGVGILFARAQDDEKDRMIASIGPFWDANETWLVLSIGILLVAFPTAYGTILSTLYLPVAVMLIGLILRGVAFEFRAKVKAERKGTWNRLFFCGSLAVALAQGFMLGLYIMGLKFTAATVLFACLTAICLSIGYAFVGATWLVLKMEGDLQHRAIRWARGAIGFVAIGFGAISAASPLVSPRIFDKWFTMPAMAYLAPLPIVALILLVWLWRKLGRLIHRTRPGRLAAVSRRGRRVRAGLRRAGLFLLPLYRARSAHDLREDDRARKPDVHADRRADRVAVHHRLHRLCLLGFPRQGDPAQI